MRIAVNTRFLLSSKMEGFGWFTYETVRRIVLNHPEHEFYFYFDRNFDSKFIFADNVKGFVLKPQARHPILFKWWFNGSIPKAIKKHQIDLFFSPDGYLSLKTSIPQVAVIHDLNFEHYPEDLPQAASAYLRKYFPLFANKADHIITVSEFSKNDIVEKYKIEERKITVAHNGGSDGFVPLEEDAKQLIRKKFTKGFEYFVFVGALHPRKNVKRLLEAFNNFKSNTASTTRLLIVGDHLWKRSSRPIETVPSNSDIIYSGHLDFEELTQVVASAKAMVFPSYFEGFGIPLIEAMKADCPILCGNKTALPEIAGDAALLFDPFSVDEITEALINIDQDADMRLNLIQKGRVRAQKFNWDFTAEKIWKVLKKYED
jgi:glycosyltransferase involved in cell wall biosynthesis